MRARLILIIGILCVFANGWLPWLGFAPLRGVHSWGAFCFGVVSIFAGIMLGGADPPKPPRDRAEKMKMP